MAYSHTNVTLKGFHFEDFHLTMNLSGLTNQFDSTKMIGKAIALDPTKPNTAKLAGDGDKIIGRLSSFENRQNEGTVVGAVEFRFSNTLTVADSAVATIAVGDTVVGAGNGEVKKAPANDPTINVVAELSADKKTAVVAKL